MNKREKLENAFLYGVFICYVLFLIKLLFLSRISILDLFDSQRTLVRSINLIPFYSIKEYIFGIDKEVKGFAFSNVIGNIAIFAPLGTYLILLKKNKRVRMNLLFIFIVSLFIETTQGLLGIGAADIDDIILNCLGGLVGILGYKLLLSILRKERKVRIAIITLSVIGLPVLLYLLFMVTLRL